MVEKNYDKSKSKISQFYKNIILVMLFAVGIFTVGYFLSNVGEKEETPYRYEIKTSNWVGSTSYKCSWYERTEGGVYKLYNEDSTQIYIFELGSGWKIEIDKLK